MTYVGDALVAVAFFAFILIVIYGPDAFFGGCG